MIYWPNKYNSFFNSGESEECILYGLIRIDMNYVFVMSFQIQWNKSGCWIIEYILIIPTQNRQAG